MIIIHPFPRPVKLFYVFMIWNCFSLFSRVGFSSFERENASNKGGARTGALDRAKCPERGNTDPLLPVGVPAKYRRRAPRAEDTSWG